jgi:hypothetical protein
MKGKNYLKQLQEALKVKENQVSELRQNYGIELRAEEGEATSVGVGHLGQKV